MNIHPLEVHNTILGNDLYYVSPSIINTVKRSLVLIKATNVYFSRQPNSKGQKKLKVNFTYNNKYYSNISVTDPEYYKIRNNTSIIVISLPDDEWSRKNSYFKFVAKIFSLQ